MTSISCREAEEVVFFRWPRALLNPGVFCCCVSLRGESWAPLTDPPHSNSEDYQSCIRHSSLAAFVYLWEAPVDISLFTHVHMQGKNHNGPFLFRQLWENTIKWNAYTWQEFLKFQKLDLKIKPGAGSRSGEDSLPRTQMEPLDVSPVV